MKKLTYIGPYGRVEVEGVLFASGVPTDCPDKLAERLLARIDADGPIFSEPKAAKAAKQED